MKMHKNMTNTQLAELLRSVAASYEVKQVKNARFKIVAYQRAADSIEHLSSEAKDLWDEGKLEEVSGIGESINEHLSELFKKGKSSHFEKLMEGLPPAMFSLMEVPGIGVKTAYRLSTELKISDKHPLEDLEKLATAGKIATLPGYREKTQEDILLGLNELKERSKRMLLPYAYTISQDVLAWVKKHPSVRACETLGSLRRRASTIGDIDIAASTDKPTEVLEHFTKYPQASRVLEKGDRSSSIVLPGNVQVDLMVQPPEAFGSLLQHFTGSKHHNIALREYALKKGLSLSEYGIKELKAHKAKRKEFKTEEEFYGFLGLSWIPPELREDTGEIQAALLQAHSKPDGLPKLVELKDIKGDLQMHSNFDIETSHDIGESSMEELAQAALELNYQYIAMTEHNPSQSKHTGKQMVDILKRKRENVEQLNYSLRKRYGKRAIKVFNSLEIDMLPDGNLPVPEEGLETLDFGLVSIHSSFRMNRKDATKRVLTALAYPKIKIFAHPTGRRLNHREGVELEWEKIFEHVVKSNQWIEINAEPERLDLPDFLVREAVKKGVKLTLGTDSHSSGGLENMRYGVFVARRGWATKSDIINTRNLVEFEKLLIGR